MNTKLEIENKLKENFNISELILIDESHKHKNHKKDISGGTLNRTGRMLVPSPGLTNRFFPSSSMCPTANR